jgi:hypothetical protein
VVLLTKPAGGGAKPRGDHLAARGDGDAVALTGSPRRRRRARLALRFGRTGDFAAPSMVPSKRRRGFGSTFGLA